MTNLIYHHYPQSPVAHKIRVAMAMKNLSWHSVEIPRVPPKPFLMPLTAGYRRTPVLQIGADIYCDSQNIAMTLEDQTDGPSLFPDDSAALHHLISDMVQTSLFDLAVRVVITSVIGTAPEGFINDRGSLYFGPGWTVEDMQAAFDGNVMQLQSMLTALDAQVGASEGAFLAGNQAGYADAAIEMAVWFITGRWEGGPEFMAQFKNLNALAEAAAAFGEGSATEMEAEQALAIAKEATSTAPTGVSCHYSGGFEAGQMVSIRQAGMTADPDVVGRLRYMDAHRIGITHESDETDEVVVHLPIRGYVVKRA